MDTSKKNILMCEKAVEIQSNRLAESGDVYRIYVIEEYNIHKDSCASGNLVRVQWSEGLRLSTDVWWLGEIRKGFMLFNFVGQQVTERITKAIWLPRQDQLQEMVNLPIPSLINGFIYFSEKNQALNEDGNNYPYAPMLHFNSMEQLWLAFVMHEKFNKIWTGTDWEEKRCQTLKSLNG